MPCKLGLAVGVIFVLAGMAAADSADIKIPPAEIRIGVDAGDLRGNDQRALQAAVDHIAGLGGGTVHILPGRYLLRNALTLRDNVRIVGSTGKTVLVAEGGVKVLLACDGDCNERQITLQDAKNFKVGDGVVVQDERNGWGYYITAATLTARVDDKTFRLSRPLYLDYMMRFKATASLTFPVVGGWQVKNAVVEGLTIEGNRDKSAQYVDGCRAGGIFLHECENIAIRNCVVRDYNGDGIVCGVSKNVIVEDCLTEKNAGHGLHPGSGSFAPIFRRNRALKNGQDGLFVCWRVKHGLFEKNEISGNRRDGISIGHRDTDNVFRGNDIIGNERTGILFRDETEPMGAHRNLFVDNRILDNCPAEKDRACIVLEGHHHDVIFRNNTIGHSKKTSRSIGILHSPHTLRLRSQDNRFLNVQAEIEAAKPK